MYLCISYNTAASALPDIYAQRQRASAYGTAQFKLHTCVCITRVYLVTPVKHF